MKLRISLFACLIACAVSAQQFDTALYAEMRWRMIGPFRGGRTVGATGVPQQPNVFYMAANNGGVWKSKDYGHVWRPIFDSQPTQSVGAIAVAPSDPNIIFVGSGEGLQRPDLSVGDGMYKSTDAGKTWTHLGLRDGQQINTILIDPRNPNRVFVAVLGHPYGPNPERGVFRSNDGGATWEKVLYRDENTGAIDLIFDPKNPDIIYADLWAARQGPWENGAWNGPESGVFKSTDGGNTWKKLTNGLPSIADGLARVGLAIAPSDGNVLYGMVDANPRFGGLFRSDDAGENWHKVNGEQRLWGRGGDFAMVRVDPRNVDKIYVANTSTYRSIDGGKNFTAIKGAPGGDDYHMIWINPDKPDVILLGLDQGATITVNGGETWSSWYNQPTAQFYHVATDNRFPYWVYGGQQESGSAGVASRGDAGAITFRDWHPVGVEEYGYVAPDPLNPNLIYGGKVTRFDQTSSQTQEVGPNVGRGGGKYRFLRTAPLLFSPTDLHTLYLGAQVLLKTVNGGSSWQAISPDLSREKWEVPDTVGIYKDQGRQTEQRRGVIYTIAPSYRDGNVIWCGTDDGLIQLTKNGGARWTNVTPKEMTAWSKISVMDTSHSEPGAAYAAVNRFRLDDLKPHIYRTHDFGKNWTEIVKGLPDGPVNAVKEDPIRKGLLFAATERGVFVSFNDGDDWQTLNMNLPPTSVRDIVIHEDDLVAGTHGRGFWILDDISPLRQLNPAVTSSEAFLFKPQPAYRVRRNTNTDTPLPPEEPAGQNPPDGAIIDYVLKSDGPVWLEIFDSTGKSVRKYSSTDRPEPVDEKEMNIPTYWVRMPKVLPGSAGMHRWVWDERYAPPPALRRDYPISAIYGDTPTEPLGPWVLAGSYTAKLTAAGKTQTQTFTVKMDPRIKTPAAGLAKQFELASKVCNMMRQDIDALTEVKAFRAKLKQGPQSPATAELDRKAAALEGTGGGGRRGGGGSTENFTRLNGELAGVLSILDSADAAPTTQATASVADLSRVLAAQLSAWNELRASAK
jgi:photosystem II stability/assembly factor-like uncharacterized protein